MWVVGQASCTSALWTDVRRTEPWRTSEVRTQPTRADVEGSLSLNAGSVVIICVRADARCFLSRMTQSLGLARSMAPSGGGQQRGWGSPRYTVHPAATINCADAMADAALVAGAQGARGSWNEILPVGSPM